MNLNHIKLADDEAKTETVAQEVALKPTSKSGNFKRQQIEERKEKGKKW